MTTATAPHPAGEELMALVDGELTGAEFRAAEEHLASCELCAGEVARLQKEALALNDWSVPQLPQQVEAKVLARLNSWSTQAQAPQRWAGLPPQRRLWYGAAALTACAVTLALFIFNSSPSSLPHNLPLRICPQAPHPRTPLWHPHPHLPRPPWPHPLTPETSPKHRWQHWLNTARRYRRLRTTQR